MEKIVQKVSVTRKNWYEAFKMACNIKGYEYYQYPDEIRYRYPAPGSVALDETSYPHLFKKHWKTPFRDSPYNIRRKEKKITMAENTKNYISGIAKWDPITEPYAAGLPQPRTDDLIVSTEHPPLDSEEMVSELWKDFAAGPAILKDLHHNESMYFGDYSMDYNQV